MNKAGLLALMLAAAVFAGAGPNTGTNAAPAAKPSPSPSPNKLGDPKDPKSLAFAMSKMSDFAEKKVAKKISTKEAIFGAPELVEPAVEASVELGASLLISWGKTAQTKRYHLQISETPSFQNRIYDQENESNFYYAFDSSFAGKYYWRVRSIADGKESAWSKVGVFTVKQGAAQPDNGSVNMTVDAPMPAEETESVRPELSF